MPRTLNDVPTGGGQLPPKGKYNCVIINVEKGTSKLKHTPQIEVTLSTGDVDFCDQLYVTPKTLPRLCLFAKRVCDMPAETVLPDEDLPAAVEVAKFIMGNAMGKKCLVTIEENPEIFIPTTGPDAGRSKTIMKRKVAFRGYEKTEERQPGDDGETPQEPLPF